MKKIISFLFLLSLLIPNTCYPQSGWFWQNPLPQGNALNAIQFLDLNNGYACGDYGTFLKTSDGGANWISLIPSSTLHLSFRSMSFINVNTGWVSSSEYFAQFEFVGKTTNGGLNWTFLYPGFYGDPDRKILFINQNTGFLGGYEYSYHGPLYRTTNSGVNWQPTINICKCNLFFVNDSVGWCLSHNYQIYPFPPDTGTFKTTNSGSTWFRVYPPIQGQPTSVYFADENTGLLASPYGNLVKTTNGGLNWTYIGLLDSKGIYFVNINTGYALSTFSYPQNILKTTNSGQSWNNVFIAPSDITELSLAGLTSVYAVTSNSDIIKTTNEGLNWSNQSSGSQWDINDVFFTSNNTGYAGGNASMIKTTNGGWNWSSLLLPAGGNIRTIFFINDDTGWVAGNITDSVNARVLKTTDGGLNWSFQAVFASNFDVYSIFFIDNNTGWIASRSPEFGYTTNGGTNWLNHQSFINVFFYDVAFLNNLTGFLAGNNGIYKSVNGGVNWEMVYHYSTFIPSTISIVDQNNIFVVAKMGTTAVLKSTNAGINWTYWMIDEGAEFTPSDLSFTNSSTGYAVGRRYDFEGKTYITTNGGESWAMKFLTSGSQNSVFFINENTGWIVGKKGTILKTTDGGGLITSNYISRYSIPSSPSLSQNYPNPFNPVTRIRFSLPVPSKGGVWYNVRLVIYDIRGREIETIIPSPGGGQEGLKPGSYEVQWNGSLYASGVYFYKLVTDDFVETRKMVLIK